MGKLPYGDHSGKDPEWYWRSGLHDTLIVKTEAAELDYDYTQRNPVRNCFTFHLDPSQAMFDTRLNSIMLYNYRILRNDSVSGGLDGSYWVCDRLEHKNGKYILQLTLGSKEKREFVFEILFEDAKIERIK